MVGIRKKLKKYAKDHKKEKDQTYSQEGPVGLLVTQELEEALAECRRLVDRVSKECRQRNRKFRDIEFDLDNDQYRCLYGIAPKPDEAYNVADVQRVTQVFDNPEFFKGGADSGDIVQGAIGDCWFLSALATMSTNPGLVEKFCIARDEQVGVYGFIFFRDGEWKVIIVDDLLCTSIPKFEELSPQEKQLYHNNKEQYNTQARKGTASLLFGRSGTQGETWVPLLEKAFAKLHGSYFAIAGGFAGEAIEDLTGGVTTSTWIKDILDTDRFWKEELLKANVDRLFGVAYNALDGTRNGESNIEVNGLIGSHAYSVLRAVGVAGKRFVVLRNPWGQSEWTGPWSDGSSEWTAEWLARLPEIGHSFGNDGQFIMEYKDFLQNWENIERTMMFNSSWLMSSRWLRVSARPMVEAWSFGDVSFTISVPNLTPAVIVLSKLNSRYFKDIAEYSEWTMDFVIYKKGDKEPYGHSTSYRFLTRSVNLEIDLEAGEYVVHVRLDRHRAKEADYISELVENWDPRDASRVLTEKAKGEMIAANESIFNHARYIPIDPKHLAGADLDEIQGELSVKMAALTSYQDTEEDDDESDEGAEDTKEEDADAKAAQDNKKEDDGEETQTYTLVPAEAPIYAAAFQEALESLVLGLRVYTYTNAPATVKGQLRYIPPEAFAFFSQVSLLVDEE